MLRYYHLKNSQLSYIKINILATVYVFKMCCVVAKGRRIILSHLVANLNFVSKTIHGSIESFEEDRWMKWTKNVRSSVECRADWVRCGYLNMSILHMMKTKKHDFGQNPLNFDVSILFNIQYSLGFCPIMLRCWFASKMKTYQISKKEKTRKRSTKK